jgi:hypothetical protein
MSELIVEGKTQDFDLTEFSIQRFADRSLEQFWRTETFKGKENAL